MSQILLRVLHSQIIQENYSFQSISMDSWSSEQDRLNQGLADIRIVKMYKSGVSILNKDFASRQNLFLKDPKSDTLIILKEKIYPLHQEFLTDIQYFSNSGQEKSKVYLIDAQLDEKILEAVLGYFYGKQLQFYRNWDLIKVLKITTFLGTSALTKKILCDLKENFDEYGFFLAMQIGQKFKIKWLRQRCQQELLLMGFEQMNFNKYDLLQVNQNMFERIIKMHEILRINQNITGIKQIQLKKIIKEYCSNKELDDNEYNRYSLLLVTDNNARPKMSKQLSKKLHEVETNLMLKSSEKLKQLNEKRTCEEKVEDLRLINTNIQDQGNKLIEEIKSVNKNCGDSPVKIHSEIEERIKEFERVYQEQDVKYLNLKNQMQKLHQFTKKTQQTDSEPKVKGIDSSVGSSTTKTIQKNASHTRKFSYQSNRTIFLEMPKLSREMD